MWAHPDEPPAARPDTYVAGLLEERRGYLARGRADRVAQVDAELARFGVVVGAGPVETAVDSTPKERRRSRG